MGIVISSDLAGTQFSISRYGVVLRMTRLEMECLNNLIDAALEPINYDEVRAEPTEIDEYA